MFRFLEARRRAPYHEDDKYSSVEDNGIKSLASHHKRAEAPQDEHKNEAQKHGLRNPLALLP